MSSMPPPDKKLDELHVWTMIWPNGAETMISADLPLPIGTRHAPLMSSNRDFAAKLEHVANAVLKSTKPPAGARVELRTFVAKVTEVAR